MNSLIKLAVLITKICSLITSKIWKQHFWFWFDFDFKISLFSIYIMNMHYLENRGKIKKQV